MKLTKYWPIALLASVTFFLRIVNVEQLFYFTYDESVPAFVGKRLIQTGHIPLIGGVTPFGVHLAPYFYWFLALLLKIGNFNPLIWGYVGAFLAIFTTIALYIVGNKFGGKLVGFLASTFWTFSYLTNIYDRRLWALYWGPIVSLITIYSLFQIINKKEKYIFLLAPTLAFAIHADPSNLVFLFFTILIWIIYKLPIKKLTIIGILILLLSFVPLVVFDLRHDFANTKPFLNFVGTGQNKPSLSLQKAADNTLLFPRTFSRLVYTKGDNELSKQYSYCASYAKEKLSSIPWTVTALTSLLLISFVAWSIRQKGAIGWKLTSGLLATYFLGIQVYGTIFRADIFEHYITGALALFVLVLAKIVSTFPKKVIFLFILLFLFANLNKIFSAKNDLGLTVKKDAINYTMQQIGDKPFSLDSLSTCWKLNGYRYLFAAYGREPVKSYVDPNFAYLYGNTQVWDKHPETVVAFIAHDFQPETESFFDRYNYLKSHEIESRTFGALELLILDNPSSWFDQPIEIKNPNIPISVE